MADPNPVDITVKITDKFSKQIQKLKDELRSIQNRVDVNLSLDDGGDIDLAKMSLADIDNLIEVLVDVRDGQLDAALLKAKALDGMESTVNVGAEIDPAFERRLRNFEEYGSALPPPAEMFQNRDSSGNFASGKHSGLPVVRQNNLPTPRVPKMDMREAIPSGSLPLSGRQKMGVFSTKTNRAIGKLGKSLGGVDSKLRALTPSMHKWMKLVAALIPMMITLGVQALGVASAMGAVGVAGAGMLTGLLGYGDGLNDSLEEAKKRVSDLATDLFEVFEPTFDSMQPITEQLFDMAPNAMRPMADGLRALQAFDGTVFESFRGISEWIGEGLEGMARFEPIISQLALRFGELIGTGINEFFAWLTAEAYNNQEALIALWGVFSDIMGIVYDASKAVSLLAIEFAPLFSIVKDLTGLLDNQLVLAMAKALTMSYALGKAIVGVKLAVDMLSKSLVRTGIGALLVGGGMIAAEMMFDNAPPAPGSYGAAGSSGPSGGGATYIMNVDGDTTNKHMNKWRDATGTAIQENQTDSSWTKRT